MAFHSRPCLAKAETKRACSSSVQYCRRLVRTYFLRGGFLIGEVEVVEGNGVVDGVEVGGGVGIEL